MSEVSLFLCSHSCSSSALIPIFYLPVLFFSFHFHCYFLFPLFAPIRTDLGTGFLDMISLLPPPSCCFLNFAILPCSVPFPFLPCGFRCLLSTSTPRGTSGLLTAKPKGDFSLLTPEDVILLGHRSVFLLSRPPCLLISPFPVWCSGFNNFSSVLPVSWHSMEFCLSAMLYYTFFFCVF